MKVLNLLFHPNFSKSIANKTLFNIMKRSGVISTSKNMYELYPDFKINIEKEQKDLMEHDYILFQFPLYWYSAPALFKQWQDDVFQYEFAFGSKGDKLSGKLARIITTCGAPESNYIAGGTSGYTLSELFRPIQCGIMITKMIYLPYFCIYSVHKEDEKGLKRHGGDLVELIKMGSSEEKYEIHL